MPPTKTVIHSPDFSASSRLNILWGFLAILAWAGEQMHHAQMGNPFSWAVFGKGLLLLLAAAVLYYLCGLRILKGFWNLGFFPLIWLAVSEFQWQLCTLQEYRYWLWLVLFLASEIFILSVWEGRFLLGGLVLFWTSLIWLFKFSFLLPLTFIMVPSERFKNAKWVQWGGVLAGLALFFFFKGRFYFQFTWIDLYELLFEQRFFPFFLLAWLGFAAVEKQQKGTFQNMVFSLLLILLGFLFWSGLNLAAVLEFEILKWVLVFMAGFGFEAFRKYLLNPGWMGRSVWLALGFAFFSVVL